MKRASKSIFASGDNLDSPVESCAQAATILHRRLSVRSPRTTLAIPQVNSSVQEAAAVEQVWNAPASLGGNAVELEELNYTDSTQSIRAHGLTPKRQFSQISNITFAADPESKRPRLIFRGRHTLDPATFPKENPADSPDTEPPLFFSHTPRQRPPLLPSFSSSEAAATMLNKARDERPGMTTLKLARGSMIGTSPPRMAGTPGSFVSFGRSSTPRSPDVVETTALQSLAGVGIIDLLEQDDRPTFVIDLANMTNYTPGPLQIVYANPVLKGYAVIYEMVTGTTDLDSPGVVVTNTFPEFKEWLTSFVKNHESLDLCLPSFLYGGMTWNCSTLKKRFRVVNGQSSNLVPRINPSPTTTSNGISGTTAFSSILSRGKLPASPLREAHEPHDYFGDALSVSPGQVEAPIIPSPIMEVVQSRPGPVTPAMSTRSGSTVESPEFETSCFDWTRLPMSPSLPRHVRFAKSFDWASTSLGPMESWSFDLRAMCNLIMGSPNPAAMYWGDDYIAIYNEAYVLLAGQKHPQLMGQSYKVAWGEIWPEIEDVFVNAKKSGQATMKDDDCLFIMRNGYLEESYFSWSIVPLVGEDGSVAGLYNPAFEKTRRKIAERRMLTLREVGEKASAARDVKGFWAQVLKGLEYNEYDVPFVYLYSVSEDIDSDLSSMHSGSLSTTPQCVLEGTLGVPEDHNSTVSPLDLRNSDQSWAPYLREAVSSGQPMLSTSDNSSLSSLISGLGFRGWGDACRACVVCPIHPTTGESILGFLVMGVNPRRPYDDDYSLFIQLLSRQLATSMASVVLFEEEIRRGQRAARLAAQDRIELSKQLDQRTQEAAESETKFTRMAEFAPVGMFIANSLGSITYSNDTWWEITRHPRETNSEDTWMTAIMEEDRPMFKAIWHKVVVDKIQVSHEFRVKAPFRDQNGNRSDTWVLMNAYPEKNHEGELKSIFGCLTNISQQKWAEDFQKRRMEEAVELKRQQENFIDMTSHEMRNPLSAILQCADEISTTLGVYRAQDREMPEDLAAIVEGGIDAAQTIALCAQHQKRIVDDILTLSKLDSALLLVTPVDMQPVAVVQRALKMFEGELDTNDIRLEFQIEQSYIDLKVDWVKLDPSRLLQVLINLTTNAIKFTHTQAKRTIIVSVGASNERPTGLVNLDNESSRRRSSTSTDVAYFPSRSKRKDLTTGDDWGTGEDVFVSFAVQDTGRGLDEDEKMLLFRRFSQTSPRTHVQYGGSGLGLFISRELTELQGGEIGVASERGVGSVFAFYVRGRRADAPLNTSSSTELARKITSGRSGLVGNDAAKCVGGLTSHRMAQPTEEKRPVLGARTNSLEKDQLKILIVEDNLVNQKVLQKQLRNLGCTTHVANHGVEAIDVLKISRYWNGQEQSGIDLTVILMDLEMPVMDGLTCAKRIRELEADGTITKHVPIIAVTANARLEQIETAISSGMDDVMSKPFRVPELMPKIQELMQKFSLS